MRVAIVTLLGLVLSLGTAGCDKGSGANGQGNAAPGANVSVPGEGAGSVPGRPVTGRLDRSHAGTPAPTSNFEGPDGRPTTIAAYRGRPVLVNLWATWCGPCVTEMPSLDALAQQQGDAIRVLALSQDMQGREVVTRFFQEHPFQRLEANLDSRMDFMTALRIDTLPTTILYDAQGREVWRMTGMADWDSDRARGLLAEAAR